MIPTEQQLEKLYHDMVEEYGDKLASYDQEPLRFVYQLKMFRYFRRDLWPEPSA